MAILAQEQDRLAGRLAEIRPHLDERQWRLLLGAEARAIGRGGVKLVAKAAGASADTVSRGARELESVIEPDGRVRRKGAGQFAVEEADPGLVRALQALVDPESRGDPESPLRWTTKSTSHLAGELAAQGHAVTAVTVARLLRQAGYSLQGNAKTIEGKQHPDRDVLSAAAGDRPLLCLVDDAGWLDYESAVALAFAARRLEAEAVVVIVAARSVAGTPFAGFPAHQIEGLSRSQAETLLAAHHPRVDPLIRERLIERADGNPLALLEFANRLQDAAQLAPPFAVGLAPTAVESLYLERVRRLPDDTKLLLLVAAAEDSQALGLIIRAGSRLGLEPRALEPAEQAGIVSVAADQIMFGHPLARSATYTGAAFAQRQRVHEALADACGQEEPDRRAWHHAAAALAPNEEVARELESTARRAQPRSGQAAASAALERAAQLSGDAAAKAVRLVAAAEAAWRAGNGDRAIALIGLATALPGNAQLRADAAEIRGLAQAQSGTPRQAAAALAVAAQKIAPVDHRWSMRLATIAAEAAWFAGHGERLEQLDTFVSSLPASPDSPVGSCVPTSGPWRRPCGAACLPGPSSSRQRRG